MKQFAAAVIGLLVWSGAAAAQGAVSAAPPGLSRDSLTALAAVGDAAWDRADHPAAFAAYDAIVRADSAFSTRVLFRTGMLHAWSERLDAAIACQRLYVRLEPTDLEGRTALARTLSWASRFNEAIIQYDSVLARDANYRDASLGKALTYAWWGRYDDALAIYNALATQGDALEARKGRARVLAWRGDLGLAEDAWQGIVRDHPEDASAWVGLAQVLRWASRPFAAERALERALAIIPNDRDAREQLRWVRVETRPQATLVLLWAEDSEQNTLFMHETRGAIASESKFRLTGVAREKRVGSGVAASERVVTGTAQLQWQPGDGTWTISGEVGAVQFPAMSAVASTENVGGLRAAGRLGKRWRVGVGAGREALDEVLSTVDRAVTFSGGDLDLSYAAHPRVSIGLAASSGEASGRSVSTARTTALGAVRFTASRAVQLALIHREVAWSEPAYGVFFAPQRFALTEASVSWSRPRDLGILAGADLGFGAQGVRFESDPLTRRVVPRAALRLGWRPQPGREVLAGIVYANVAGAGAITASEYRYGALTLTGRWTF